MGFWNWLTGAENEPDSSLEEETTIELLSEEESTEFLDWLVSPETLERAKAGEWSDEELDKRPWSEADTGEDGDPVLSQGDGLASRGGFLGWLFC